MSFKSRRKRPGGRRRGVRPVKRIDVQQDRRLNKIEKKIRDSQEAMSLPFAIVSGVMNATPQVVHIDPATTPDGLKSKMLMFEIHGVIKQDLASAIIDDYRMDLVLDKTPNKLAQLPVTTYGSATPTIETLTNQSQRKRFRIIRSWRGYLSSSEGSNSFRKFDAKIRLGMIVETSADGNFTATNLLKNNLSLIRWTTATANQPIITFSSSILFGE